MVDERFLELPCLVANERHVVIGYSAILVCRVYFTAVELLSIGARCVASSNSDQSTLARHRDRTLRYDQREH